MIPIRHALLVTAACFFAVAHAVNGQQIRRVDSALIEAVMPGADRFDEASGDPPVVKGFRRAADGSESLYGYVFLTSDLPPEQYGYSGPIEALVGMTLDGVLTGVRVVSYRESYMQQMGDFLRRRGFQEQFADKYIGDPFRVWGDVDGISRVSISVRALARGVRDSARRVAAAYSGDGSVELPTTAVTDIVGLTWFELRQAGVVERFEVEEPGEGAAGISVAYIAGDRQGEYLFGRQLYERALRAMERREGADHLVLYGVDGSRLRLFLREGWSIVQGADTLPVDPTDIVALGLPSGGAVAGEVTMVGLMLVRGEVDIREPFTFVYDLDELGVHEVEYTTQEARILIAEAEAAAAAEREAAAAAEREAAAAAAEAAAAAAANEAEGRDAGAVTAVDSIPTPESPIDATSSETEALSGTDSAGGEDEVGGATAASGTASAVDSPAPLDQLDFAVTEEESLLQRTLAETQWSRVALMLLVLGLATWAFASKTRTVQWLSLGATLVLLGFVDGGFLSVSHITSGIWAGPGVYLRDLPLLLIVAFTVVTTLVWGRVFCGFLCPFGALQDVIDRVVPDRFKRPLPQRVHDRAIWIKYGILALVVVPALLGSRVSVYQYVEPFGTVFFLSTSLLFWAIAGGVLVASVVVPRFYCRYACPLGAALALTSLLAVRRIRRVEQCDLCKVCEQRCPTGAIRGPAIDFKECVRCNVCEVALIEQHGVCRHDMETIRPRLVQLTVGGAGVGDA